MKPVPLSKVVNNGLKVASSRKVKFVFFMSRTVLKVIPARMRNVTQPNKERVDTLLHTSNRIWANVIVQWVIAQIDKIYLGRVEMQIALFQASQLIAK